MKYKILVDKKWFRIYLYPKYISFGFSLFWQKVVQFELDLLFWSIEFGERDYNEN